MNETRGRLARLPRKMAPLIAVKMNFTYKLIEDTDGELDYLTAD
jgi:hypothetical protein